jgi:hypothetical protein
MSYKPYQYYNDCYNDISGIGHGSDWANGYKNHPDSRSFWPPGDLLDASFGRYDTMVHSGTNAV